MYSRFYIIHTNGNEHQHHISNLVTDTRYTENAFQRLYDRALSWAECPWDMSALYIQEMKHNDDGSLETIYHHVWHSNNCPWDYVLRAFKNTTINSEGVITYVQL